MDTMVYSEIKWMICDYEKSEGEGLANFQNLSKFFPFNWYQSLIIRIISPMQLDKSDINKR